MSEHTLSLTRTSKARPTSSSKSLSPSTAERDKTFKRSLYAKHGVKEYWLVDTDAGMVTVLVWDAHHFVEIGVCGKGQTLSSPTLKGFTLNSDEIF